MEFNHDFWEWWDERRPDPVTGQPNRWGDEARPTATAAVHRRSYRDAWGRYLALHRHGGIEMGLARDAVFERGVERVFRLTTIVGRVWAAFDAYGAVVEYLKLSGPWEVCFAVRRTMGALLGNFGTGWAEPGSFGYETRPCGEPNLLVRYELANWPNADGIRVLAWRLGAWLEDAWGTRSRRFLAHRGEYAHQFGLSSYRWG